MTGSKGVSVEYLSTGANRQTAVADWSRTGVLAYGADCNIALWEPAGFEPRGVFRLLSGHQETVKALAFLPETDDDPSTYLISGSDDRSLIVWRSTASRRDFEIIGRHADHSAPINCISALRATAAGPRWVVATGAADATIRIWIFEHDQLRLAQTIATAPKYFPLALSLGVLGGGALVLAAAGTRDVVQILTAASATADVESPQFSLQATLSGHEGWIRSLSFARENTKEDSDVLLASASQDKYLRIWRIHRGRELPKLAAEATDSLTTMAMAGGTSPSNKAYWLKAGDQDFSVTFEALLLGHEDWIYSARWHAHADKDALQLLSTSADNSLAIWEADAGSGIWVSTVRLGEISREKGATTATGSTGGFWTGLWSPDGRSVACLGRTGSWRRWEHEEATDTWRPCVAVSGHTKAVTGIAWSRHGDYLLSTSLDQTTRLHMQWKKQGSWHEVSRPQIHGYDLNCIDSLGESQFVSGADEKLMRVFDEPKTVAAMLSRLGGIERADLAADMPDAANMPVLGLSNKAIDVAADDDKEDAAVVEDGDRDAIDPASIVRKSHVDMDHPPLEETLSRHTLWPEKEKLYGHGYEISCLAASHDGRLIASACRASSVNHAVVRLFETQRWTEVKPPLQAHSLTITRVRFSRDDAHLLTVGRDRQWTVFARAADAASPSDDGGVGYGYRLLQANPKGHSRMILDAAWAPYDASPVFATAGRDKQVRIWAAAADGSFAQVAALPSETPATAVDFLPYKVGDQFLLAIGTEAGRVSLCLTSADGSITELGQSTEIHLAKSVTQLAWRPTPGRHELAVAGEDSSLRIYSLSPDCFGI